VRLSAIRPWMTVCAAVAIAFVYLRVTVTDDGSVHCGAGFAPRGLRCCPIGAAPALGAAEDVCGEPKDCPQAFQLKDGRCEVPITRVKIAASDLVVGASDWEALGTGDSDAGAEGRIVKTAAFEIDRYEITVGQATCPTCALADARRFANDDHYRAMSPMTRDEAQRVCATRNARLPTEVEWIAAAVSGAGTISYPRYPWGNTGAVCRRDTWGIVSGPCGQGAIGPDSVASHPDGVTTSTDLHNMSGNVSEWVINPSTPNMGVVRGGSYASAFAAELRVWARRTLDTQAREPTVGARCVYEEHP
jgi:formylglycine-generating enzyme